MESSIFSVQVADFSEAEQKRGKDELLGKLKTERLSPEDYVLRAINAWDPVANVTYKRIDAYPKTHPVAKEPGSILWPEDSTDG